MHDEYHVSRIVTFIRLDHLTEPDSLESWLANLERIESLSEEDEELYVRSFHCQQKISWLEVPIGMTILQLLQLPHHLIVGGMLHLIVLVRGNEAHKKFLRDIKERGEEIQVIDTSGVTSQEI